MGSLGEKIKQIRLSRGLTQQHIANELGVARNTISQWENNERNISADQLISYAQIVKVPLDFFDNRSEDENFFAAMQNLTAFFSSENVSSADKDTAYQDIMRLYLKSKEMSLQSTESKAENTKQDNTLNAKGKQ